MMGSRGWLHQLAAPFQFDRQCRRSNCSKYQLSIEKFRFGTASSDAEIEVEQGNLQRGFDAVLHCTPLRSMGAKVGINPNDLHTANVFAAIRGKTDQFTLRFRKPA
jgi:hypothetical protein